MRQSVLERMRSDWNDRAAEDAYYFVAFGRRQQDQREFFQTADEVLAWLRQEMRHLPRPPEESEALEIGCGPARLMRPLSESFRHIYGVDVSDRMIEIARRNLAGIGNAHVSANSGADLSAFGAGSVDFVYSYAVFQHIPSRDVVLQYLREAVRVLKTNGILTCQINGLQQDAPDFSTWDGARVPASAIVALAMELDCQILALDGVNSQYMWTTWRKRAPGWRNTAATELPAAEILDLRSAAGQGCVVAGGVSELIVSVRRINPDWDVADLAAYIGGQPARVRSIDSQPDQAGELRIFSPPLTASGASSLELLWRGRAAAGRFPLQIVDFEKPRPALVMLTDGINILSGRIIICRFVKIILDHFTEPRSVSVEIDGQPVKCSKCACIDEQRARYECNAFLSGGVGPGSHRIDVFHGSTRIASERISVGILQAPDVFRAADAGAKFLEVAHGQCAVITTAAGAAAPGVPVIVDPRRLPFGDGEFAGIVWRDPVGNAGWPELRRILKPTGGVYVEVPAASEQLAGAIARQLDLPYCWKRDLARPLGSRRPSSKTRPFSVRMRFRAVWSALLRVLDRCLGSRTILGGAGYYFGRQPAAPDLRARLNGCVGCGDVASSDQLTSAGPVVRRFGLPLYLCPSCGAPNIFTADA